MSEVAIVAGSQWGDEAKKINPISTTKKGIDPCFMDKANCTFSLSRI